MRGTKLEVQMFFTWCRDSKMRHSSIVSHSNCNFPFYLSPDYARSSFHATFLSDCVQHYSFIIVGSCVF
jgi:hypothetical protein